jgi:hypothetical protein
VIVVGYGTISVMTAPLRKFRTGISNLPFFLSNCSPGQGRGVFINSESGKLGQAMNIRVRGFLVSASQRPF